MSLVGPRSLHLDAYPVLSLAAYCFFHMFEGLDVAGRGRGGGGGGEGERGSEIH